MKLVFYEKAREDYLYWQAHDRKLLAKRRLVYRPSESEMLILQCRNHYSD